MITVVVADDQELVRAGFRVLIEDSDDIEVIGEASNGQEAVEVVVRERPDVVLMDVRMPTMDGLQATKQIRDSPMLDGVRVLILTTFDLDEYVHEALRNGASGFLLKDTSPAELLEGIRVVHRGDALLSPSVTRKLIENFVSRAEVPRQQPIDLAILTEREREVLSLVGRGLSNDEIAERLVVSPLTSKTHVSRVMTKLGARDRAQLVVLAYETGLVKPGL